MQGYYAGHEFLIDSVGGIGESAATRFMAGFIQGEKNADGEVVGVAPDTDSLPPCFLAIRG
jgi:hypothetical protein